MTKGQKNIIKALITLAECIDQLEKVPPQIAQRPQFRTRKQLIKDILSEKS